MIRLLKELFFGGQIVYYAEWIRVTLKVIYYICYVCTLHRYLYKK